MSSLIKPTSSFAPSTSSDNFSNKISGSSSSSTIQHRFEPYADNGGSSLAIAGEDYCIIASDTRQSDGYLINSRNEAKAFKVTDNSIVCVNGYHADGLQLVKDLQTQARMYKFKHDKIISTQSLAQLTMTVLYGHRFFPYYTHTIIGGLDDEGKGAVYSFDPVGSFERECHRAAGSAASLLQPFLDSQIGRKNQTNPSAEPILVEEAIAIAKDAFSGAAERDIYTGDSVDIWIITKDGGCRMENHPLRRD